MSCTICVLLFAGIRMRSGVVLVLIRFPRFQAEETTDVRVSAPAALLCGTEGAHKCSFEALWIFTNFRFHELAGNLTTVRFLRTCPFQRGRHFPASIIRSLAYCVIDEELKFECTFKTYLFDIFESSHRRLLVHICRYQSWRAVEVITIINWRIGCRKRCNKVHGFTESVVRAGTNEY